MINCDNQIQVVGDNNFQINDETPIVILSTDKQSI